MILGMTTACSNQSTPRPTEPEVTDSVSELEVETPEAETKTNIDEETESINVYKTTEKFTSESELLNWIKDGTVKVKDKAKEIAQSDTVQHAKDTIIHSSKALADFIILDEPIGGMRFSELSAKAKQAVVGCLISLDNLAKEKVPEQYATVKEKMIQVKNKCKDIIIDVIGEENYHFFGELKDKTIEKGKELYENGKQYIKDKYKDFREK